MQCVIDTASQTNVGLIWCLIVCLLFLFAGSVYKGHVEFLAPTVAELAQLEKAAQTSFIDLKFKKKFARRD